MLLKTLILLYVLYRYYEIYIFIKGVKLLKRESSKKSQRQFVKIK